MTPPLTLRDRAVTFPRKRNVFRIGRWRRGHDPALQMACLKTVNNNLSHCVDVGALNKSTLPLRGEGLSYLEEATLLRIRARRSLASASFRSVWDAFLSWSTASARR